MVGETDKDGGYIVSEMAYTIEDYAATVYDKLGLDRSEQLRDVRSAQPAQSRLHLDVGVDPGLQPAEELHDRRVAEDHRGVRLLAGQHEARLVDRDALGRGVAREAHGARPGAAVVRGRLDPGQPGRRDVLVVQRVVHPANAVALDVDRSQQDVLEMTDRFGAGDQRQLIGLRLGHLGVAVGDLCRPERDLRYGQQLGQPGHLHVELAALAGEPALGGQEPRHQFANAVLGTHRPPPSAADCGGSPCAS